MLLTNNAYNREHLLQLETDRDKGEQKNTIGY